MKTNHKASKIYDIVCLSGIILTSGVPQNEEVRSPWSNISLQRPKSVRTIWPCEFISKAAGFVKEVRKTNEKNRTQECGCWVEFSVKTGHIFQAGKHQEQKRWLCFSNSNSSEWAMVSLKLLILYKHQTLSQDIKKCAFLVSFTLFTYSTSSQWRPPSVVNTHFPYIGGVPWILVRNRTHRW